MPYGHASMSLLGEGSEATEPYNKYDKIRPHSIRSLQFDQKVRPLSFRPEKFDLFTATLKKPTIIYRFAKKRLYVIYIPYLRDDDLVLIHTAENENLVPYSRI